MGKKVPKRRRKAATAAATDGMYLFARSFFPFELCEKACAKRARAAFFSFTGSYFESLCCQRDENVCSSILYLNLPMKRAKDHGNWIPCATCRIFSMAPRILLSSNLDKNIKKNLLCHIVWSMILAECYKEMTEWSDSHNDVYGCLFRMKSSLFVCENTWEWESFVCARV